MCRFLWILISAFTLVANPLLKFTTPIPWDQIQPAHIKPAIDQLIKEAELRRVSYVADKSTPGWENSIAARERITENLLQAWGLVGHLQSVNNSSALRGEFNATQPLVTRFFSTLGLDTAVYSRVKAYAATAEAKALTGDRKRYLGIVMDDYRRSGVALDEAKRTRLLQLRQQLTQLTTKFAQNALDSTNAFELIITDAAQLAGLPETARQAAALSAKSKGKEGYRFVLQAPSIIPVLQYSQNAELREKLSRAATSIASAEPYNNRPIIEQIVELRRELASILGYKNFADYQSEQRMAQSGQGIKDFLSKLETQSRAAFEKESAALLEFRRALEGKDAPALRNWDTNFYTEKLRQKEFQFDQNELRPYLELNKVLTGMFGLVKQLYGIEVTELKTIPVWNPQVRAYRIIDNSGKELATFYADFFPRESKRSGAWMNNFFVGSSESGKSTPHIGTIVCNITPPNASGVALLSHSDVVTVFHEFGHLLHLAFREGSLLALNRTNVPWDFIELPSQIMENFTWEKSVLNTFAVHHETGVPLPDALFEKMTKARTFMAGSTQMRQLSLGTMDIQLHTDFKLNSDFGSPVNYARQIAQRFRPSPLEPEDCPICNFSHVFAGGYAAGYYSYKWAEVLDSDAFSKFKANGVISRKTGEEFRKAVLGPGNAKPASILFRDFMGRDPDPTALLRRSGLAK